MCVSRLLIQIFTFDLMLNCLETLKSQVPALGVTFVDIGLAMAIRFFVLRFLEVVGSGI